MKYTNNYKSVVNCTSEQERVTEMGNEIENTTPVAYGVTQMVSGRTRQPVYLITSIAEDGTVTTLTDTTYKSWQEVTIAAKKKAIESPMVDGEPVHYWIADQIKAFQKRIEKL